MTYYLIKETDTATVRNFNCKGTMVTYNGKKRSELKREGTYLPQKNFDRISAMIEEFGFKTEAEATRSSAYKNCISTSFWESNAEIVKIEV